MTQKKISLEKNYWNQFYHDNSEIREFLLPSQFCCLMSTEVNPSTAIAEFGCGNGRDSVFLARHGFKVAAMDLSNEAIDKNNKHAQNLENITFYCGDVSQSNDVKLLLENARSISGNSNIVVYSRFFLHSIDDDQEASFMKSLSDNLISGDKVYFEFRAEADSKIDKIYGNHYRRFVNSAEYSKNLEETYNFSIEYSITGQGMAKYKSEDPFVTRITAIKQ